MIVGTQPIAPLQGYGIHRCWLPRAIALGWNMPAFQAEDRPERAVACETPLRTPSLCPNPPASAGGYCDLWPQNPVGFEVFLGETVALASDLTVAGPSPVTGGVGVPVIQAVCSCASPQKILAMICGNSAGEIIFLMPAGIDPKDV